MSESEINLPAILPNISPSLRSLTEALGVPRSVLASDEEIEETWQRLPRLLKKSHQNCEPKALYICVCL